MKRYLLLFLLAVAVGCNGHSTPPSEDTAAIPVVRASQKGESTSCAYWKCSKEKKLYMQKYVRSDGGEWRPAGTFKLGQGIGAFPLEDLDKYGSSGEAVSIDVGLDPCPYCSNTGLGQCHCGKTLCEKNGVTSGTCPWCGASLDYRQATWGVGGSG